MPDNLTTIILPIPITKDCVNKVQDDTLIFGVVAIITPSMEIEMGLRLLPDLEAYIKDILYIPEFKNTDCCINEFDCKTMHWDPDGNGNWNVKSKIP